MVSLDKRDTEGHEQRGSTLGTRGQSATGPTEGPRADSGGTNSADTCALDLWPLNPEDVNVHCWRLPGSTADCHYGPRKPTRTLLSP